MCEHLDTHEITGRAFNLLALYRLIYILDLMEIKLTRKHHDVGELRIKLERVRVRNAQLCGDMDFHSDLAAIHYRSHVRRDNRIHTGRFRCVQSPVGGFNVFLIKDNVQRQICLDPVLPADPYYFSQIFRLEIVRRMRPHIEVSHTEIYGIRSAFDSRHQAFEIPRRGHYLQFLLLHHA